MPQQRKTWHSADKQGVTFPKEAAQRHLGAQKCPAGLTGQANGAHRAQCSVQPPASRPDRKEDHKHARQTESGKREEEPEETMKSHAEGKSGVHT